MADAYMAWSHDIAGGKTPGTEPLDTSNGRCHSLRVVDVFGMYILFYLL